MSDTVSESVKYKWTPESTALLVSVWSDRQVQKQLEYAPRPQVIWESVARYMHKKGYNVGAKQCRSRMKQVLVCYKEAKQAGTRSSLEQYYEIIDRVMRNKRLEQINVNGIDTVDANMKSPPKDVKTNKNLQMRLKVQEPVQSLHRTDALSPTWMIGCENEYPDSPESNETIIARPYGVFSPTRDIALNTNKQHLIQIGNQAIQTNTIIEEPMQEDYRQNLLAHYPYGEIPYQNTVQNVQNQIIQENMQQNIQQNRVWHQQLPPRNVPTNDVSLQQNVFNHMNRRLPGGVMTQSNMMVQNSNAESVARQQNQPQQSTLHLDNRAMPQEPRKISFGQNLLTTDRIHKQYRDIVPRLVYMADVGNKNNVDAQSPEYSPDVSQNLNDAFCQSKSDEKAHNLNETYSQPGHPMDNPMSVPNTDTTVVTNNATCNDDTLLLEYLLDSPTPSEKIGKSRDSAVNTDNVPNAPFRKKKAQKLEQLVLSAINSQNEVVNKILAAQNDMVTRFLDVDRDRQNRLEIRLDHLLNVVHATVLSKNEKATQPCKETSPSRSPSPPAITSLHPPPKPGMVPPKLDLVPPKPCRIPCTIPSSNVELINHNPISTRPGVVSPITANHPVNPKPGTIWSKLGPVSQSPFVKAQQRLGLQTISTNNDARMQSSAERRIVRELGRQNVDARSLIRETIELLEAERQLEERIENARLETAMILGARRRLFTRREPTPIVVLTAAFLDAECRACGELDPPYHGEKLRRDEGYERMHHLNTARRDYLDSCEPCDSSTPIKLPSRNPDEAPKQTIQQLARLVMNSARWRDPCIRQLDSAYPMKASSTERKEENNEYNATFTAPKANAPPPVENPEEKARVFAKSCDVMQRRQGSDDEAASLKNDPHGRTKFPMGFTTAMLIEQEGVSKRTNKSEAMGFVVDDLQTKRRSNVRFSDDADAYATRQAVGIGDISLAITGGHNNGAITRNMIQRYVSDLIMAKKPAHDSSNVDSDNDEEFLDTTATMHPICVISRQGSITSSGTASIDGTVRSSKPNKMARSCGIS
ncbi:PREDICTED: uncharacterized protein LOC106745243 [Dinoponera quadriceps]|uniref:Uncharacterized protein LOC106745243 n=1 Tax=Dinoponera quadriceps TaxID=609295 RepID=A0A6P3XD74_DINQU|nr:PREDICTED: uncharacterized protein LOC106745243 [Dinoponera quadriceps]XP_014476173.1 PREDICTED: uncharacterized protein LOC106745243 [Dinoponera quadriceps]